MSDRTQGLRIGWASRDVTPSGKVSLRGQFHVRIADEVHDPLTVSALALESKDADEQAILVSLDAVGVSDYVTEGCRKRLAEMLPAFRPDMLLISATHTHTAPDQPRPILAGRPGLSDDVMSEEAYADLLVAQIGDAAIEAWNNRASGAVSWGRGHAVVGFNRRVAYFDGSTKMYGPTDVPEFSHIEGHEDHAVELLFTYDKNRDLTGMVVNVPCPAQCSEQACFVSADYWHDARREIRKRHGEHLHILPQCSAAGDLSPRTMLNRDADARMLRLRGLGDDYNAARRTDIADKLATLVDEVLPPASNDIRGEVDFKHRNVTVELTRRRVTENELREAEKQVALAEDRLSACENAGPASFEYSSTFRRRGFNRRVVDLYRAQQRGEQLTLPVELHVLRIGDVAMCANRFEYYLDFGERIKGRSKALQTFVVQLAGAGTYLPTQRSVQGGSYGAYIASTPVGFEGGQEIVEAALAALDDLFDEGGE